MVEKIEYIRKGRIFFQFYCLLLNCIQNGLSSQKRTKFKTGAALSLECFKNLSGGEIAPDLNNYGKFCYTGNMDISRKAQTLG